MYNYETIKMTIKFSLLQLIEHIPRIDYMYCVGYREFNQ